MQVLPNKAPGHISALVQKPQLPRSCGELSQIFGCGLMEPRSFAACTL